MRRYRLKFQMATVALLFVELAAADPVQEQRFVPVEPHSGPLGISESDPEVQRQLMRFLQEESAAGEDNYQSIQSAFRRIAPFLPELESIFEAEGLPAEALWMGLEESRFLFYGRSNAGARGPFQFLHGTFREECGRLPYPKPGSEVCQAWNGTFQPVNDPVLSARLAAKYLRKLRDEEYGAYLGTMRLALMAYNGGLSYVQRCLRDMKSRDPSSLWQILSDCMKKNRGARQARENRSYPFKVVAATILSKRPEDFGLYLPRYTTPPYVYLSTQGRVARLDDLDQRVEALDGPLMDQLESWNPALWHPFANQECLCTPRGVDWGLRVPAEDDLAAEIGRALLASGEDPCC